MKNNINFSRNRLKPTDLVALAKNIVSKMTDNSHFPTPHVSLVTLSNNISALDIAIGLATEGSKANRIARNILVSELNDINGTSRLCTYDVRRR